MPITAQYLTGEYQEKNPSFHVEDSPWKARQIQKMLDAQGISPRRVAEVGCGAGEILAQLARLYPDAKFDGFEISRWSVGSKFVKTLAKAPAVISAFGN